MPVFAVEMRTQRGSKGRSRESRQMRGDGGWGRVLAPGVMRSDQILVCAEDRANVYKERHDQVKGMARWPPRLLKSLTLRTNQELAMYASGR